jgi:hypothetical protein
MTKKTPKARGAAFWTINLEGAVRVDGPADGAEDGINWQLWDDVYFNEGSIPCLVPNFGVMASAALS